MSFQELMQAAITKRRLRIGFVIAIVLLLAIPATSLVSGSTSGTGNTEFNSASEGLPPSIDGSVVVTSQRRGLVVFWPNGSIRYEEQRYDAYGDIDPVNDSAVLVVAQKYLDPSHEDCPEESQGGCHRKVVDVISVDSGEHERIYEEIAPGQTFSWHDVDRLENGNLLVADISDDTVFIINPSNNVVEWMWRASSSLKATSGGFYPDDWTHLNDVEELPSGQIMVSLRNQDRVVFIDREEGLIRSKTLGCEDCTDILYEQHNPDYIDSPNGTEAVLVSDSENNRIVEYERRNGSWEQTWSWKDAQLQWPRDADRLPGGNTLVVDSNGNRILLVDTSADVVWQTDVPIPYDAEVLGTGDESRGGSSASSLGIPSRGTGAASTSQGAAEPGITLLFKHRVVDTVPSIIINGIIFILPPSLGFFDVFLLFVVVLVMGFWIVVELYWKGYQLTWPIRQSNI